MLSVKGSNYVRAFFYLKEDKVKERFLAYLKENKKKVLAFIVAGVIATLGISMSQEASDAVVSLLDSISNALFETSVV